MADQHLKDFNCEGGTFESFRIPLPQNHRITVSGEAEARVLVDKNTHSIEFDRATETENSVEIVIKPKEQ